MTSNIAPGGSCQQIAISAISAQSANINACLVQITPTVDCFMRAGSNPTALSTGVDHFLVAGATQEFRVISGQKIAFITTSASGSAYIVVVG